MVRKIISVGLKHAHKISYFLRGFENYNNNKQNSAKVWYAPPLVGM